MKEFKEKIKKKIRPERVILFGSRARGDNKESSDFDVIIVSSDFKGIKFFKRSPPLYLLWNDDSSVDIICLTPEELVKKQKMIGVIQTAVKEGINI